MDKTRVEAFSDGVLAIAITLLVLDLQPPAHGRGQLWHQLLRQWPNYASYSVSFAVIGIIWVNHHTMFRIVARVDRPLLFLNLLTLLVVAALPFPTALLADNIRAGGTDAHVAAAVYSATMLATAVALVAMWQWVTKDGRLLRVPLDADTARRSRRRYGLGIVVYVAALGLSFVSAPATLALHFAIAVYYIFDQLPSPEPEPEPA